MYVCRCVRALRTGVLALSVSAGLTGVASALEPDGDEKARLEACERRLCDVILDKAPAKGPMACDIAKTWNRTKIEDGASARTLQWGFGDARCQVAIKLETAGIVAALTAPKYELQTNPHQVACVVETDSGVKPVKARIAPKLKFEGGQVRKIWLGLQDIDGPSGITTLVRSAAYLEDTFGIFHKDMVKQVNKFVHEKCAKGRADRIRVERIAHTKAVREARLAAAARRREAAKQRRAALLQKQEAARKAQASTSPAPAQPDPAAVPPPAPVVTPKPKPATAP